MKDVKVESVVKEALNLTHSSIKNLGVIGGMTNLNYLVAIDEENYIVRIPGNGTASIISREHELQNLKLGSVIGINPELVYFNVATGVKITKEVAHAKPITKEEINPEIINKVAAVFQKLHHSKEKMSNTFNLFGMMLDYERLAMDVGSEFYLGFDEVKKEVQLIQEEYHKMLVDQTSCHIDPACSNFLINNEREVYLIDWEYGGMFDPLWDVAAFSLEAGLSPSKEKLFYQSYFQRELTDQEQKRIIMHHIFQDYLWSIWTLFKEEQGDNFGLYGRYRFERAKENIVRYKSIYSLETTAQ